MAPVALAFAVLELGGSATDLGIVLALAILPQVFFLLVGGVIADRMPRHLVMVASNLVAGPRPGGRGLPAHLGQRRDLAARGDRARSAPSRRRSSTRPQQGIVPQTVPTDDLQSANALLRLALNATNIGGAALGGLLVALAGPGWAIAFDALSYLVAAAILLPMKVRAPERDRRHELRPRARARAGASSAPAPGSGSSCSASRSRTRRRRAPSTSSAR